MDDNFKKRLIKPEEIEEKRKSEETKSASPEIVLDNLSAEISDLYNKRIIGLNISSGNLDSNGTQHLGFTFYLVFARQNDFSYRLFEAKCENYDGGYPLTVTGFYAPPIDYGKANNDKEFREIIEKIISHERTRNVILSMY